MLSALASMSRLPSVTPADAPARTAAATARSRAAHARPRTAQEETRIITGFSARLPCCLLAGAPERVALAIDWQEPVDLLARQHERHFLRRWAQRGEFLGRSADRLNLL